MKVAEREDGNGARVLPFQDVEKGESRENGP